MMGPARAGVLIYGHNLTCLSQFYRVLLQMELLLADEQKVVLENSDIQLVIYRTIAEPVSEAIAYNSVAQLQGVVPFFTVPSLAWAQLKAADLGGIVFPGQWLGAGFAIRHGQDPEGNLIQLREFIASSDERMLTID